MLALARPLREEGRGRRASSMLEMLPSCLNRVGECTIRRAKGQVWQV